MSPLKIVVTGPVNAGKTTFIRSLSDRPPLTTEQQVRQVPDETHTTVGLDFGQVTVGDRSVKLFGTPGQERFGYMREILSVGADGIVLLIPRDGTDGLQRAREILEPLPSPASTGLVVGITRTDLASAPVSEQTRHTFEARARKISCIDARKREECRKLLTALIEGV